MCVKWKSVKLLKINEIILVVSLFFCTFAHVMSKSIKFSEYQLGVFDALDNTQDNIAINAVAGSGKTTTIVEACKRIHCKEHDTIFLAFNKLIVNELKTKLKGVAEVSTLHAFGFQVLKKLFNMPEYRMYIKVDSWKYQKYVMNNVFSLSRLVLPTTENSKVYGFCRNVAKIYSLARVNLVKHGETEKLRELCDNHNIITFFDEIEVCDILLADAYKMPKDMVIDYTDMIVLPLTYCEGIPSYKYVFIDECQDLNRAQRELMLHAARRGRFIAVGDRNQAINGFAGADCNSFDKIATQKNTIELPLSVNYRCGTEMLKLAQEIVPNIQACDNAIEGKVDHIKKLKKNLFKGNDMVLCRTSAPLVGMCMKLIESGVTAIVKGKDIGQDLLNLVENANTSSIESVLKYLANEKEKCIATLKAERKCDEETAKHSVRYINLEDRCKCIENICTHSIKDVCELKTFIEAIFSDENIDNAVMLSTVHKSKGLEADRVFILLPEKLPLIFPKQLSWQLKQEMNLKYVALTRAKKELIFVDLTEKELMKSVL